VAAACVAGAFGFAVLSGLIALPGAHQGAQTASAATASAGGTAGTAAANEQWASGLCTNVLAWKNEIQHDATSLDLGFGAVSRLRDATAATTRLLDQLGELGLPPGAESGGARAQIDQLRADIQSRARNLEGAAASVESGNLAAIGTLVSDLKSDEAIAPALAGELRRVVSVDLGLSLAETRACRELVGVPV
jgi:hypothetical protein